MYDKLIPYCEPAENKDNTYTFTVTESNELYGKLIKEMSDIMESPPEDMIFIGYSNTNKTITIRMKKAVKNVADILDQFKKIGSSAKENSFNDLIAYEEAYMRLLKKYQDEIHNIEDMMLSVRKEREDFYTEKLPAIKSVLNEDMVDAQVQREWIEELIRNTEKSLSISESLIEHYITKNLEEFKHELNEIRNRV